MIIVNSVLLLILILFIIIKTVHFLNNINSKHRKLINWFYFNHNNIIKSRSSKSAEAKKRQNALSVSIGIVMLVILSVIIFEYSVLIQPLPNTAQPNVPKIPQSKPKRQTD